MGLSPILSPAQTGQGKIPTIKQVSKALTASEVAEVIATPDDANQSQAEKNTRETNSSQDARIATNSRFTNLLKSSGNNSTATQSPPASSPNQPMPPMGGGTPAPAAGGGAAAPKTSPPPNPGTSPPSGGGGSRGGGDGGGSVTPNDAWGKNNTVDPKKPETFQGKDTGITLDQLSRQGLDTKAMQEKGYAALAFTATWCGPCQSEKPTLNKLKSEGKPVTEVDVDQHKALADKLGVTSMPTIVYGRFDDKGSFHELKRNTGIQSEQAINGMLGYASSAKKAADAAAEQKETKPPTGDASKTSPDDAIQQPTKVLAPYKELVDRSNHEGVQEAFDGLVRSSYCDGKTCTPGGLQDTLNKDAKSFVIGYDGAHSFKDISAYETYKATSKEDIGNGPKIINFSELGARFDNDKNIETYGDFKAMLEEQKKKQEPPPPTEPQT